MTERWMVLLVACLSASWPWAMDSSCLASDEMRWSGARLAVEQVSHARLRQLKEQGVQAIVISLQTQRQLEAERQAIESVKQQGLQLYYWIEVARCPMLADQHPEWMASLQGHAEWRRLFPEAPQAAAGEVIKTYPWVPILSQESFAAQWERVRSLLAERPKPRGVFLNDLQGAPSACGCGNPLCRWTTDYGPIRQTTPLKDDAAARFVAHVQQLLPKANIVPVWTTECERKDGSPTGHCAGVGCFDGICWKAYVKQLEPVARQSSQLGVLLPYRSFGRDTNQYEKSAGWIGHAVSTFDVMLRKHQVQPIRPQRLIAVLQGWDVSSEQIDLQQRRAREAGVGGTLISFEEIDQSWEPKLFRPK